MESSEYSISRHFIKIGETTYENALEERIQAAKADSLRTNTALKKYNKVKLPMINSSNISLEKGTNICTSLTSVQNRLFRAREEIKSKSMLKMFNQKDYSKFKKDVKPLELDSIWQDTNTLIQNKNKTKRLNNPDKNISKRIPSVVSNYTKKMIISSDTSETVVSTKLEDNDNYKESNNKECFGFNWVIPKNMSAQRRLENIKKKSSNDVQIMEWEDVNESNDVQDNMIVDRVNDLRKNEQDYDEVMEWTPDSIMDSDQSHLIKSHCLVIDTNIFLSDLKSVTKILDTYLPDYGYLTIVLPYQVLCELDVMKNHKYVLAYQAREATRWLLKKIKNNHPRLKGQPMTFPTERSDDAILQCAIDIKERVNSVCLITNDNILSLKSLFSGIPVQNISWLKNLISSNLKLQGLPLHK